MWRIIRRTLAGAFALVVVGLAVFRFWPHDPLPAGARADAIMIDKTQRTLSLMRDGTVIKTYRVALGLHPRGHKLQEGDMRTPEGRYQTAGGNAGSGFYRSIRVSYPNAADTQQAAQAGVDPGGDIMVHGIKNGFGWLGRLHRLVDWTDGCIAVTDQEMREIWNAVPHRGAPIDIRP